jgi:hypothetical protein
MDYDRRPAVLVVTLVVLAGCGGVPFGGDTAATPPETLTPAPVPATENQSETATPVDRPPGVTADGFVDGAELATAHEVAIENRSYTWVVNYEVVGPTQSEIMFDQGFRRRALVDGDRFLVTQTEYGEPLNQSLFVDDSEGYLRVVEGNETRREPVRNPGTSREYDVGGQLVQRFLAGMDPNVTRVQQNGQTYYRLYDETGLPVALERLGTGVQNYRVTAYVTPSGFVRSMGVSYERAWDTGVERISIRFDYSAVGATTVETPAWVSNVSDPTPTPVSTPTPTSTAETAIEPGSTTETAVGTAAETASRTTTVTETPSSAPTATPTNESG